MKSLFCCLFLTQSNIIQNCLCFHFVCLWPSLCPNYIFYNFHVFYYFKKFSCGIFRHLYIFLNLVFGLLWLYFHLYLFTATYLLYALFILMHVWFYFIFVFLKNESGVFLNFFTHNQIFYGISKWLLKSNSQK